MGRQQVSRPIRGWREFELIAAIRRQSSASSSRDRLGIGDDASAHRPRPGYLELVTCDALIEGVHWEWAWCDPFSLGQKTAAVNLSDLAAMGGIPERAHLALALPRAFPKRSLQQFIRGLVGVLERHGAALVGGDTNASPGPMMITLMLQGAVLEKEMLTRSGARPGDCLMVTGHLGEAAAALRLYQKNARARIDPALRERLLHPVPRLAEGRWLARRGRVHALLDLSDGLAGDVRHLAEAGKVGVLLWAGQLPVSRPWLGPPQPGIANPGNWP